MHTPIGVKPVAGSKEWREAWQKRAFAHISNGYKHIYIAINSPEIFLLNMLTFSDIIGENL